MPKFDIPTIYESLKHDYLAHKITAHDVARELSRAGWTPYVVSDDEALAKIGVEVFAHCTCCGKPLTENEACYTNMQNLFEGRYICWECGL